jgi:hypothetical protein
MDTLLVPIFSARAGARPRVAAGALESTLAERSAARYHRLENRVNFRRD